VDRSLALLFPFPLTNTLSVGLNSLVPTSRSLSTISSALHPVLISFPAYQGDSKIRDILTLTHVQQDVVGANLEGFSAQVYQSFLASLTQLFSDSTRNVKDFIRLGRSLWPMYMAPLQAQQVDATVDHIRVQKGYEEASQVQPQEILTHLGRRFLSMVGRKSKSLLYDPLLDCPMSSSATLEQSRAQHVQPSFLSQCLMLAAFICQHNRKERDKKVFSLQSTGKRKRKQQEDDEDQLAFEPSEELKSLRPRPFPLERVLSIFVMLVKLNSPDIDLDSLGTWHLFEDIAQWVDLGLLHPDATINYNRPKFWCSLTKTEALRMASKIGIPLETYIV